MSQQVIAPASIPQSLFIKSDADITIASGSAGSSKSYSILLRWLRFCNDPEARGIVFRRTLTQIETQGGLWEEGIALYSKIYPKLKVKIKEKKLIFPSGATLKFSHYENEAAKEKFKGLQADYIAFDEATEFTEEMIVYLMSRNRNVKVKHKCSVCMATNPDEGSFLKSWVWRWLDTETGIPKPSERGKIRYFARNGAGDMVWFDTKEEAEAVYGTGADNGITSMMVIGSTCYDNPFLPPDYIGKLKALKPVERDRLLYGSWTAKEEGTSYWKSEWVEKVPHPNGRATTRVRAWDLASSVPSSKYKDPDYTAGVLMSKDREKYYTIEEVEHFRAQFMGVEQRIIETAKRDGRGVTILIPQDVGAMSTSYAYTLQAKLANLGFTVRLIKPKADKVTRFGAFASMSEARFVRIVDDNRLEGDDRWIDDYIKELERFDGGRKFHDDMVDATSDAFNFLIRAQTAPNVNITSYTQSNVFAREF